MQAEGMLTGTECVEPAEQCPFSLSRPWSLLCSVYAHTQSVSSQLEGELMVDMVLEVGPLRRLTWSLKQRMAFL